MTWRWVWRIGCVGVLVGTQVWLVTGVVSVWKDHLTNARVAAARDIADAAQAANDATTRQLALCEQRAAACAEACGP